MLALSDLRFVSRQLLRRPGFSALVVATLALGSGAAAAVFAVVDHVLVRPLPFPQPGRLVALCETHPSVEGFCVVSPPNAADWAASSQTLASIGQGRTWAFTMRTDGRAEHVRGGFASAGLFATLQLPPAVGRTFESDDEPPSAPRVAMLSHAYWKARYGGEPSAVGRTIDLDGTQHRIVGVLPAGGDVPLLDDVQVWTPFPFDRRDEQRRRWRGFVTIGRMAPTATGAQVEAELAGIQQTLAGRYPATNAGWGVRVTPLLDLVVGRVRPRLLVALAAVTLLLLIACANVASLLLVSALRREPELAIRASLGAGRARLLGLVVSESVMLALVGCGIGALLSTWMANALLALMPGGLPRVTHIALDLRLVAVALAAAVVTGVLASVLPALRASRVDLVQSMRAAHQPARRARLGSRGGIVIAEVTLAVLLACVAGLLGRSFAAYLAWEPGFDTRGLLTFWTLASSDRHPRATDLAALFDRVERSLAGIPGVVSVGMVSNGPLFGGTEPGEFRVEGLEADAPVTANWFDTSPTYFATLGRAMTRGRPFTPDDRGGAPPVAIVNETFVRRYVGDRDAIGQRVTTAGSGRTMEIVGVVRDVPPFVPGQQARPEIYWPFGQSPRAASFYVMRTTAEHTSLVKAIEARLHDVDPDLPIANVATMDERVGRGLASPRFQMLLIGAFALVALLLTMIGVFGVMASSVSARQREIGVRMALGSTRGRVLAQVMREGLRLTGLGVVAGLGAAAGAARLLEGVVPGVPAIDVTAYALVAGVVIVAAAVATFVPARRAASVDPVIAIRMP